MRPIKFRAFSTGRGAEPHYVYLDPESGDQSLASFSSEDLKNEKDWIVEQFTGLLDKNGKEIYEGDILFHEISNEKLTVIIPEIHELNARCIEQSTWSITEISEVIGNVHENPELLKV
jgi:hypothetical protein